ncbi:hypothetical protein BDZ91DRAFT_736543, partial [Kalaharituber pfeilii]
MLVNAAVLRVYYHAARCGHDAMLAAMLRECCHYILTAVLRECRHVGCIVATMLRQCCHSVELSCC